jgi:beta-lactamase superfamily II metal-dependent hydrolase
MGRVLRAIPDTMRPVSHLMERGPPMSRIPDRWPSRALRPLRWFVPAALALLLVPALALAAGNGKLQIHHIDVGQGDGILIISPLGETALVDDGTSTDCSGIESYLQGLGLTSIKYHFASHYHSDHIGCIDDLAAIGITISTAGYDRGGSYSSSVYTAYVNTLGSKRTTISTGQTITLDAGATYPVTIKCVRYGAATSDENSNSMVLKVSYGAFDEVMGGDLTSSYESSVGSSVGDVEVYKVHHHGSSGSTSTAWLSAITPEVGIISVGDGNSYGHPTSTALTNLHNASVHTYWTETGAGVSPNSSWDQVGGTIIVQAQPGASATYTVSGTGISDTYTNGGGSTVITDTKVASAVTMTVGSVTSGSVTNLAANDASRMTVTSAKSGSTYYTDWYGSATLAGTPTSLTVTYDGKYSVSRTQTLYLYNFSTSAWTQINSATVSTSDVTKTWTTTSPASYVSSAKQVRLRVKGDTRTSSYTCQADYMAFTYTYTSGSAVTQIATEYAETPAIETADGPADRPGLSMSVAPNPFFRTARFAFTLGREADVRLDIFDLSGRRVATPYSATAPAGTTSIEWSCSNGSDGPVPAGVYFARIQGGGQAVVSRLVLLGR